MKFGYNKNDNAVILIPETEYDNFILGMISTKLDYYMAFKDDGKGQYIAPPKIDRMEIKAEKLINNLIYPKTINYAVYTGDD